MSVAAQIHIYDKFPETTMGEIFGLIEHTAKNLRRVQRRTVREVGLTPPQYGVLHMLWERDERPFKDLADALLCTRATITGIIDTLERKGFVMRKPNPADRRSILAALTDEGRDLQHSTPALDNIYNSCCSGLAPLEFQQLGFLLQKLNDSLNPEE
ncbi:MAG: MarR family transcriptional regulator [Anaerolineaceae bacterium]|nr:MAG: MarR family transcriptional regulator [Anaerolineaceae bacterium]